jgi:transcriptional regulator with PAS, ATPase and Fis domain
MTVALGLMACAAVAEPVSNMDNNIAPTNASSTEYVSLGLGCFWCGEGELFGHTRGAFTGAIENKPGLVRAADGGTLFLDEIGELPPEVQAKLLRLLQEQEVRPIGAAKAIKVDVRILAATNRDLPKEIERGRFREDLYYRLKVITIRVPPLRDRKEDIPALIHHFVRKYATDEATLSQQVYEHLLAHDWPGNVRQIENTIRGMMALKSDPVIGTQDLPSSMRAQDSAFPNGHSPGGILPMAEVERRHILHTLEYTKGDVPEAAGLLGIGKTTLYRKIKEYNTSPSRLAWKSGESGQRYLF